MGTLVVKGIWKSTSKAWRLARVPHVEKSFHGTYTSVAVL